MGTCFSRCKRNRSNRVVAEERDPIPELIRSSESLEVAFTPWATLAETLALAQRPIRPPHQTPEPLMVEFLQDDGKGTGELSREDSRGPRTTAHRRGISTQKPVPADDGDISSDPEDDDGTETSEGGHATSASRPSSGLSDGPLTIEDLDKRNKVESEREFKATLNPLLQCMDSDGIEETQRSGPANGRRHKKQLSDRAKKGPRVLPGTEKGEKAAMAKLASHTRISFSDLLPDKERDRTRRAQAEFDEGRVSHAQRRIQRRLTTGAVQKISAPTATSSHTTSTSGKESSEDFQRGRASRARYKTRTGTVWKISVPSATSSHTTSTSRKESSEDSQRGRASGVRYRTRKGAVRKIRVPSATSSHTTSTSRKESSEDSQRGRANRARYRTRKGAVRKIRVPSATSSDTTSTSRKESSEDSQRGSASRTRYRARTGAVPKSKGPASRARNSSRSGNCSAKETRPSDAQEARNSPDRRPPGAVMQKQGSSVTRSTNMRKILSDISLGGNFSDEESDDRIQTRNTPERRTAYAVPKSEGPAARTSADISRSGNFSNEEPDNAQMRHSSCRPTAGAVPKSKKAVKRTLKKVTTILSDISLGGIFSDEEPDDNYFSRPQIRLPPRRPSGAIPRKGISTRKTVITVPSEKAVAAEMSSTDSSLSDSVLSSSEEEQKSVHSISADVTSGEKQRDVVSLASSLTEPPPSEHENGPEPIAVVGVPCQRFRTAVAQADISLSEVCSGVEGGEARERAARPVAPASRSKELVRGGGEKQAPCGRRRFGRGGRWACDDALLEQMLATVPDENVNQGKERLPDGESAGICEMQDRSKGEMAAGPAALASGSKEISRGEPVELVDGAGPRQKFPSGRRRFGRGRRWDGDDAVLKQMLATVPMENETEGKESQLQNNPFGKSEFRECSSTREVPSDYVTVGSHGKEYKKAALVTRSPEISRDGIFSEDETPALQVAVKFRAVSDGGEEREGARRIPEVASRSVAPASSSKELVGGGGQTQVPCGRRRIGRGRRWGSDDLILEQMLATVSVDNGNKRKEKPQDAESPGKPSMQDRCRGEMVARSVALASGTKETSRGEPAGLVGGAGPRQKLPSGRRRFGRGRRWDGDDGVLEQMLATVSVKNGTEGKDGKPHEEQSAFKFELQDRSSGGEVPFKVAAIVPQRMNSKKTALRRTSPEISLAGIFSDDEMPDLPHTVKVRRVPCSKNLKAFSTSVKGREMKISRNPDGKKTATADGSGSIASYDEKKGEVPLKGATVIPRRKSSNKAALVRRSQEVSLAGIFSDDEMPELQQTAKVCRVPCSKNLKEFSATSKGRETKISRNPDGKTSATGDGGSVALYDEKDLQLMAEILQECG